MSVTSKAVEAFLQLRCELNIIPIVLKNNESSKMKKETRIAPLEQCLATRASKVRIAPNDTEKNAQLSLLFCRHQRKYHH